MGSDGTSFQAISLVGVHEGLVKRLDGFDKSRHTAPKFASARAQEFLGRICDSELRAWAEQVFRSVRAGLGYKRREITLDCDGGYARLSSKDFVLERRYTLQESSPSCYDVETELSCASSVDFLENAEFSVSIGQLFDRMRCVFNHAISVESIVDAIEEAEGSKVSVTYPACCDECVARVEGCSALFRFDSDCLEIRFESFGDSRQLINAFTLLGDTFREEGSYALIFGSLAE